MLLPSAPYTPHQNGRSERAEGEVSRRARAISIQSKFSPLLWNELVKTACFLLNRTPRYRLGNKTPFEIIFKKQPDLSHIRSIGCQAYYLLKGTKAPPKLHKLSAIAAVDYLIGYDGANKFRIWNPSRDVIIVTRDVKFDENTMHDPKDAIQDPQLIKENEILESIDEFSINDSIRYPHQLADLAEDNVGWGNIYDSPSSIYSTANHDNEFEKAVNISQTDKSMIFDNESTLPLHIEPYLTPESFPEPAEID
ncbi:hypothetical protein K3495_g13068 [Podosphaera aphanis]|nr:hypothetical protein K3495_g13068 [Podosphaera aphanis]